jgi:hypothetical protein
VATSTHAAIPPPVTVGLGDAAVDVWPMTAIVTSVLAAGAIEAVV